MPRRNILVVENEPVIAGDLKLRLENMHYGVIGPFTDAHQALVASSTTPPDLALLDIQLVGGMDGIELATHLFKKMDVPVVFITPFSEEETIIRSRIAEPFGYVLKPFDDRVLRTVIEMAFQKHLTFQELQEVQRHLETKVEERTRALKSEITRRIEIGRRLVRSQEQLLEAQTVGRLGHFEWDLDSDRHEWSPELYRILEVEEDSESSLSVVASRVHSIDRNRFLRWLTPAPGALSVDELQVRLQMPDGRLKWALLQRRLYCARDSEFKRLLCVVQDVTERFLALEKAKRISEDLEAFFDIAMDLHCIADMGGHFITTNPQWNHSLGYSNDRLTGSNYLDLVHPDDLASTRQAMASLANGLEVNAFTNRCRSANGQWRVLEWQARPLGSRVYASARDVTGQRTAERILRKQIEFEDMLVELSGLLFRSESANLEDAVDRTLERVGQFTGVDRAYLFRFDATMLTMSNTNEWCAQGISAEKEHLQDLPSSSVPGWMKELTQGHEIYALGLSELPEDWIAERQTLQAQGIQSLLVVPVICGNTLFGFMGYDAVSRTVEFSREARTLLRFLADNLGAVLERHRQHIELQMASAKAAQLASAAESASKAKSEFLANMSHEIRTPMNGVLGMLRLLLETSLSEKQRNYAQKACTSAESLLGVINDILDISKIEAGRLEIENVSFSIEDTIGISADTFAPKAVEKGLELHTSVDPSIPLNLRGDPTRLLQILNNLLSNAVKFTASGDVLLAVRVAKRSPKAVSIEFKVQDSGVGIPLESMAKLFHAFSQADASTTRKFGGTGLGLAISRQLCDLMGGTIHARSEEGRGSTFTVVLPFELASSTSVRIVARPPWPGLKTLIVDHNPFARQILAEALSSWGLDCLLCSTGVDAKNVYDQAMADGNPFKLCLIDWRLPDISGSDLVRHIQGLNSIEPPCVVILSAYGQEYPLAEAGSQGVSCVIAKPVRTSHLYSQILSAMGKAPAPPPPKLVRVPFQFQNVRALIVEDNEINREIAIEHLLRLGIRSDVASHGAQAVEMVAQTRYQLVLMDIQMPVMDGLVATQKIRALPGGSPQNLPILAMTAHAIKGDRERSLGAGMTDHITKPIDPEELYGLLRKHLERFLWVPPEAQPDAPQAPFVPLPQLTHIDQDRGLGRLEGNRSLYLNLLQKFLQEYSSSVDQLESEVKAGNVAAIRIRLHTLRSVAANIGAKPLEDAVAELEKLMLTPRTHDQIVHSPSFLRFSAELHDVCTELGGKLPLHPSCLPARSPLAWGTDAEWRMLTNQLLTALEDADSTESSRIMRRLRGLAWTGAKEELVQRLDAYVAKYKFEEAIEDLGRICTANVG